ncbi:MAG: response regulator [Bacteroidota bacterium]
MTEIRIVIVENDEDEQLFMREGFVASGLFDILAIVRNGNELMNWLGANKGTLPHIILSDLNMPGKNGYDIIEEITASEEYKQIPVIITSTSSTQSLIDKCLEMGAAHYLIKPEVFIDYLPFSKRLYETVKDEVN